MRLNPAARVRLGARVAALASRTIATAFADFLSKASRASFPLPHDQNEQMATAFMIADAFDELQAACGPRWAPTTSQRRLWRCSRGP